MFGLSFATKFNQLSPRAHTGITPADTYLLFKPDTSSERDATGRRSGRRQPEERGRQHTAETLWVDGVQHFGSAGIYIGVGKRLEFAP
jgi:hypothetical protein